MLGRLFNWLVMAALLFAVVWHYRDTEVVRQRRPLIEAALARVGMEEASVRRYWPLEAPQNKGSEPLLDTSTATAPSAPSSAPPSPWSDLLSRYNPINAVRGHIDPQKPASSPE